MRKSITILWSLSSKCNMDCLYCYYSNEIISKKSKWILRHNNTDDLKFDEIVLFVKTIPQNTIKRIFITGGEPLFWKYIFNFIELLKTINCEIVLCTNGILLDDVTIFDKIINSNISAISISMDSLDESYNNKYRRCNLKNSTSTILDSIIKMKKIRESRNSNLKIGIYSVISKLNLNKLKFTFDYFNNKVDYFIFQPIYLDKKNKYYNELNLEVSDIVKLNRVIDSLYRYNTSTILPRREYVNLIYQAILNNFSNIKCKAGTNFIFIQPNGLVWDCPSVYLKQQKIDNLKSIKNNTFFSIFSNLKSKCHPCDLFSINCVNIFQLFVFDDILK